MFHFPGLAAISLCIQLRLTGIHRWGCPIRRSTDTLASRYPWLIAGSYVLHRLSVPRHPPQALSSLVKSLDRFFDTIEESNLRLMQVLFLVTLAFNCQIALATNVIQ